MTALLSDALKTCWEGEAYIQGLVWKCEGTGQLEDLSLDGGYYVLFVSVAISEYFREFRFSYENCAAILTSLFFSSLQNAVLCLVEDFP